MKPLFHNSQYIIEPKLIRLHGQPPGATREALKKLIELDPNPRCEVNNDKALLRPDVFLFLRVAQPRRRHIVTVKKPAIPDNLLDQILCGDALKLYPRIPSNSIPLIVTSPPYWNCRNYLGGPNELGREWHPQAYIEHMMDHAYEWKRILAEDGSLYLNLGDVFFGTKGFARNSGRHARKTDHHYRQHDKVRSEGHWARNKQQLLLPERVAIELQNMGFICRNRIVWTKPNPIPSHAHDRRLPVHEMIYHFVKSEDYYFDLDLAKRLGSHRDETRHGIERFGEHQATFPETLIAPYVLTSSREGDLVFDAFMGSGTVAVVAKRCKRHWLGFELVKSNCELANRRVAETAVVPYTIEELIRKNGIKPCHGTFANPMAQTGKAAA